MPMQTGNQTAKHGNKVLCFVVFSFTWIRLPSLGGRVPHDTIGIYSL